MTVDRLDSDAPLVEPDASSSDLPAEADSFDLPAEAFNIDDENENDGRDFEAPAPPIVSRTLASAADFNLSSVNASKTGSPHLMISNTTTQMQFSPSIPHQSIMAPPTSLTTTNSSSIKNPVFNTYNNPPPHINTQLELHSHRLNMMENNMIQSNRLSLLEAKMIQGQQNANFHLDLPSLAAYLAQPPPSVSDSVPLVCHCGLVPRLDTVLAPGPSLGRVFYSCIQKGSRQCSFFKFKQDGLAQVNFVNNWIKFYGFFLYR